jgi:N-acetylneuraminate lyase
VKRWNLNEIKGVIPALVTPFNEDESLSEEKARHLVDYLIDAGVDGFYLTGSTGEGFLMDTWVRQSGITLLFKNYL